MSQEIVAKISRVKPDQWTIWVSLVFQTAILAGGLAVAFSASIYLFKLLIISVNFRSECIKWGQFYLILSSNATQGLSVVGSWLSAEIENRTSKIPMTFDIRFWILDFRYFGV